MYRTIHLWVFEHTRNVLFVQHWTWILLSSTSRWCSIGGVLSHKPKRPGYVYFLTIIHWPKEKVKKTMVHKTLHKKLNKLHLKLGMDSGAPTLQIQKCSSFSISGTRHWTHVNNLLIIHILWQVIDWNRRTGLSLRQKQQI